MRRVDEETPIRVMLRQAVRESPAAVMQVPMHQDGAGALVRFSDLGNVRGGGHHRWLAGARRKITRMISWVIFAVKAVVNAGSVTEAVRQWLKLERKCGGYQAACWPSAALEN